MRVAARNSTAYMQRPRSRQFGREPPDLLVLEPTRSDGIITHGKMRVAMSQRGRMILIPFRSYPAMMETAPAAERPICL
jgi:hypothetical protein